MNVKYVYGILLLFLLLAVTACEVVSDLDEATVATVPPLAVETPVGDLPVEATTPAETEPAGPAAADPFVQERQALVERGIIALGIEDETVIEAMRTVPRHEFIPADFRNQAYENHPLPIGYGQTISQPYIVALMTEAAEVEPGDKVLEIGTGSGYQAAVLAEIAAHVYSVEIIGALVEQAEADLARLGYDNVTVRHADGYFGWEEEAPFDAIVVTAAPDHVPQPLVQQLKIGGHMIIPVGPVGGVQTLWRVTHVGEEEVRTENLGDVRFVPLTREEQ